MLQTANVDLVGVASRRSERSDEFRAEIDLRRSYASYEEMLDDHNIDAVHIVLPNALHAQWSLRALERGKHVLCEKPFATSVADAIKVRELARTSRLNIAEGFMWRLHPQHKHARKLIQEGAIGSVKLVRAAFTYPFVQQGDVRLDKSLGGGCLFDVGCYPISAARFYFDAEPVSARASGEFDPNTGVDTRMAGIMEFDGGVALVDCGFGLPFRADLEVLGEKGRIYFTRAWQPNEQATMLINDELLELPATNHYILQFDTFSRSVLDNRPLEFDADDAVKQTAAIDLMLKSVSRGLAERCTG